MPYYERFLAAFPMVQALATAPIVAATLPQTLLAAPAVDTLRVYFGTYTGATGRIADAGNQEAIHVTATSATAGWPSGNCSAAAGNSTLWRAHTAAMPDVDRRRVAARLAAVLDNPRTATDVSPTQSGPAHAPHDP